MLGVAVTQSFCRPALLQLPPPFVVPLLDSCLLLSSLPFERAPAQSLQQARADDGAFDHLHSCAPFSSFDLLDTLPPSWLAAPVAEKKYEQFL